MDYGLLGMPAAPLSHAHPIVPLDLGVIPVFNEMDESICGFGACGGARFGALAALERATVEVFDRQSRELHVLKTADIDSGHSIAR